METVIRRLQVRRDSYSDWDTNNPLLEEGEIGLDTTNKLIKIGDGVKLWNELPYFDQSIIQSTALTANTTAINLASFAGKQVVTITCDDGLNKPITLNDNLKDGIVRYINVINTHASAIISVTLPAPRIYVNDVSAIPVLAGCQIQIQFYWDSAQSAFVYLDSVNMKKVLA